MSRHNVTFPIYIQIGDHMATMGFIRQEEEKLVRDTILVPENFTHAVAIGQTGSGKTTSFIYPNLKHRIEKGHGLLVYDYKGKEHTYVKYFAQQNDRLNDVIEVGKPWGSSINIIRHMTEQDLENFFETVLAHSDENRYWGLSAQSIGINVLDLLGKLETLKNSFEDIGCTFGYDEHYIVEGFNYPITKTLTALLECTLSIDILDAFVDSLNTLVSDISDSIYKEISDKFHDGNKKDMKALFQEVVTAFLSFQKSAKRVNKALLVHTQGDSRTLKIVLASLVAPLTLVAQNPKFNTDDLDIVAALNDGKIIIISPSDMSDTMLENLNLTIFNELSKRCHLRNIQPITLFLDEAQRLLSKSVALPTDVLREAKVDVILSFQDQNLVINKIGKEQFKGLMANLSTQYYFKSNIEEQPSTHIPPLDELETFEYYTSHDHYLTLHIGQPIFIDKKETFVSEFEYQKNHNVLAAFAPSHKREKIILEYIPRLFMQKKLLAYHLKRYEEFYISYEDKNLKHESTALFNQIFEHFEDRDDLYRDVIHNYSAEELQDVLDAVLEAN